MTSRTMAPMYTVAPLFQRYPHQDKKTHDPSNSSFPEPDELNAMVKNFYRRGGRKAFHTSDEHAGADQPTGYIEEMWVDGKGRLMTLAKLNPLTTSGKSRIGQLDKGALVGTSWELMLTPIATEDGGQRIDKDFRGFSYVDKPDHKTYVEHHGRDRDSVLRNAFSEYYGADAGSDNRPVYISDRFKRDVKKSFQRAIASAENKSKPEPASTKAPEEEEGNDTMDTDRPQDADFEEPAPKDAPPQVPSAPQGSGNGIPDAPVSDTGGQGNTSISDPPNVPIPEKATQPSPSSNHSPMSDPKQENAMDIDEIAPAKPAAAPSDNEKKKRDDFAALEKKYAALQKKLKDAKKNEETLAARIAQERNAAESKKRSRAESEDFGLNLQDQDQASNEMLAQLNKLRKLQGLQASKDTSDLQKYIADQVSSEAKVLQDKLASFGDLAASMMRDSEGATEEDAEQARKMAMDLENPNAEIFQKMILAGQRTGSHTQIEKRMLSGENVFGYGNVGKSQPQQPRSYSLIDRALELSNHGHTQPAQTYHQPIEPARKMAMSRLEHSSALGAPSARAEQTQQAEITRLANIQKTWQPRQTGEILPQRQLNSILEPVMREFGYSQNDFQQDMTQGMIDMFASTDMRHNITQQEFNKLNPAAQIVATTDDPVIHNLWNYVRENPSPLLSGNHGTGADAIMMKTPKTTVDEWRREILNNDGQVFGGRRRY